MSDQFAPQQHPTPAQPAHPAQPGQYAPPAAGYVPAPPAAGYVPAPQAAGNGYAAAPPTNGLALASMICGLAGLLGNVVVAFLVMPFFVSLAAVILGHVALSQLKKRPGTGGRGMAITGLVTGYVAVGFAAIAVIVGLVALLSFGAFATPFLFS